MTPDPPAAHAATGLDMLLTEAAVPPLRRLAPAGSWLRLAAGLAARPVAVARRGARLATELARIGAGRSRLAPAAGDQRYHDPAWSADPLLRRLVQVHLAAVGAAADLVADAGLDAADDERVRFSLELLTQALAPANTPLHPRALRAALDTRGASVLAGVRRLLAEGPAPQRVPAAEQADGFEAGTEIAATPGAVVLGTPVFELIQYLPRTETVRAVPLLVVPGMLNRYYLADLAPGRSIVEHLVESGQQVFAVSWRNPLPEDASWDLDTYGQAVLDALDACERISRSGRTSLLGFCLGGTLVAMVTAHLAAIGAQDRVASLSFASTVLDHEHEPLDPGAAAAAVAASDRLGFLDGQAVARTMALLQPGELVWPNWVQEYLCGEPEQRSELAHWNADATRMPAALHRAVIDLMLRNALAQPGAATLLGTPVDLSKVDRDTYVIAGMADRRLAWQRCYRSTGLLGGACRFVLTSDGHIGGLVPLGAAASFRVAPSAGTDADGWLRAAPTHPGSWWEDHLGWLAQHSGPVQDAPPELGGRGLHALAPAPGEYVLGR